MQNLRDKLLKAGLVSKDDAKAAAEEAAKKPPPAAARPPREASFDRPPRDRGERAERNDRNDRGGRPGGRPGGAGGGGGKPFGAPNGRRDDRPRQGAARPPPRSGEKPYEVPIRKLPPLVLPGTPAYQRLQSLKQVELDKRLRDLAKGGEVPTELGERMFHFVTRKGRLRRLALSEAQAKLLEEGKLAVVERPEPAQIEHSLVTPDVAEQMMALSPKAVRFFNKGGAPIGFLSEEELMSRQAREASGDAEKDEAAADAQEAALQKQAEAEAKAADEKTGAGASVEDVREVAVTGEVNLAGIATPEENDEGF